jgi:hypothetical protein
MVMLPLDATSLLGSIAGIAEIAKAATSTDRPKRVGAPKSADSTLMRQGSNEDEAQDPFDGSDEDRNL